MKRFKKLIRVVKKHILLDILLGVILLMLIGGGVLALWIATLDIPDLSSFEERRILQSTKIYDRTGEVLLYDLHQDVKRTVVPYEKISHHIKNATIAIEDDTFFEHSGVRPIAIIRSMIQNTLDGGSPFSGAGGSTITQQVIKNSILAQEKTITRKMKEAILAFRLEQVLTKEEILTHYLNESPYGGTIYGVEEASLAFFGKRAADVTLHEAAYLASLPQLPTYYSPYGSHTDELELRKNLVLDRMVTLGFISEDERNQALETPVAFKPQEATGIRAPHFVMYIRDYLIETYGEESLAERGFKVITTLDWKLQEKAEEIVKRKALENETKYDAENAALVAIDPLNGHILTMVGSRDYFDKEIDGNFNIAIAERQPGSSFKPFVYATAFEKGYTPETVVFDLKTQFSTTCSPDNFTSDSGCYSPDNYDHAFRGPVSLRNALAQSLNIPAVKLLYLAGVNDSLKTARDLGITTLKNQNTYGLTLVLGGGEVKLLEMVGAYATFAQDGVRHTTQSIIRIEDNNGTIIEEPKDESMRVLSENTARSISSILSDNVARTPLFGANSNLHFPGRDVAAKTGTTNDKRDVWIIGYTPNLVVGAWAGNNDNSSMKEISGLIIAPLWREFMDVALADYKARTFIDPEPANETLKPILRGIWFDPLEMVTENEDGSAAVADVTQAIQGAHSILYFVKKENPRAPGLGNMNDSQFNHWEYPVSIWKSTLQTGVTETHE